MRRKLLIFGVITLVLAFIIVRSAWNFFQQDLGFWAFMIAVVAMVAAVLQFLASLSLTESFGPELRPDVENALRRTKNRPTKRLLLYVIHASVWSGLAFLVVLAFVPRIRVEAEGAGVMTVASFGHWVGAALVTYLLSFALVYWAKDKAKQRKILRIEKTLAEVTHGKVNHDSADMAGNLEPLREQQISIVRRTLTDLMALTERTPALERFLGKKGPATAWILVPDHEKGNFRPIHVHPWDKAYSRIAYEHRPAMWNEQEVSRLEKERNVQREKLKKKAFFEFEKALNGERNQFESLTGFIYKDGGPRAYPDISLCEAFDSTYLTLLASEDLANYSFRSCAGIRLEVGGRPIGVLMLYDTVRASFLEADTLPLRIYGHVLSQLVQSCDQLGCYSEMTSIHS